MAIPIEGFTVVVKKESISSLLTSQAIVAPNSSALADDDIWRCSFMVKADALKFMQRLAELNLNVSQGPNSDAVLVNEFGQSMEPDCEWLLTARWEKAVIAWKVGSIPSTVISRAGWDPKIGSGLTPFDHESMKNVQFARFDGNLEVFLDKDTGEELYIARTSTAVDSMFMIACDVIGDNFVNAGEPTLKGEAFVDVEEAVGMLEKVIDEVPEWWHALFYHGNGLLALGRYEEAYKSLRRAYDIESSVEIIPRALAGVCLELQRYEEAVSISEKAAALEPDKADVLGNLAVAYLMAAKVDAAQKTISAALRIDSNNKTNQHLSQVISAVAEGKRPQPQTLRDASKPIKPKKKPFWKLW